MIVKQPDLYKKQKNTSIEDLHLFANQMINSDKDKKWH